jgi:hypothetical protein
VNADDLDPYRLERVRDNRDVPIPVPLRIRHYDNLADTGERSSQHVQSVL